MRLMSAKTLPLILLILLISTLFTQKSQEKERGCVRVYFFLGRLSSLADDYLYKLLPYILQLGL